VAGSPHPRRAISAERSAPSSTVTGGAGHGLGVEATLRFQAAQLKALQEELDAERIDRKDQDDEVVQLRLELSKAVEAQKRCVCVVLCGLLGMSVHSSHLVLVSGHSILCST
jgi:hypothetical protein